MASPKYGEVCEWLQTAVPTLDSTVADYLVTLTESDMVFDILAGCMPGKPDRVREVADEMGRRMREIDLKEEMKARGLRNVRVRRGKGSPSRVLASAPAPAPAPAPPAPAPKPAKVLQGKRRYKKGDDDLGFLAGTKQRSPQPGPSVVVKTAEPSGVWGGKSRGPKEIAPLPATGPVSLRDSVTLRKPSAKPKKDRFNADEKAARCNCQATIHKLLGNCLHCGKIICSQEAGNVCTFCDMPLTRHIGKKNIVKMRREAAAMSEEAERKEAMTKEEEIAAAAEAAAIARKERLLEYDKSSAARTRVYDDQADYFKAAESEWLTDAERADARARELERREAMHGLKNRSVKVTFDIAGRRVVEVEEKRDDGDITRTSTSTLPTWASSEERTKSAVYTNPTLSGKANEIYAAIAAEHEMRMEKRRAAQAALDDALRGDREEAAARAKAKGITSTFQAGGRLQHDDPFSTSGEPKVGGGGGGGAGPEEDGDGGAGAGVSTFTLDTNADDWWDYAGDEARIIDAHDETAGE